MSRPFVETRTSQHPGHLRFSGEPGIACIVRISVDPSGQPGKKVRLELERIIFDDDAGETRVQTTFHPALEDVAEYLAWNSEISNQVYNFVMDDIEKRSRNQ